MIMRSLRGFQADHAPRLFHRAGECGILWVVRKPLLKAAIFLALVGLIFLLTSYGPQPLSFLEWGEEPSEFQPHRARIARLLSSLGPYSAGVFVLLQALQVVASPIPGELLGVAGGFFYGRLFGFFLSLTGLALGSWIAFELARGLGRPLVQRFVKKEFLDKFDFLTTDTGALISLLLFLIPGPKDYLCYLLGLSRMKVSTFLLVTIAGRMPGVFVLTAQGANLGSGQYAAAGLIALLSLAIVLVAYLFRERLFRHLNARNSLPD